MQPTPPHDDPEAGSLAERILLWLAVIGILGLCLVVTLTVISRWLWRPLIPDDVLVVRELMVIVILFPLAMVTASRSHIAVTVFTSGVSDSAKDRLRGFGDFVGLLFVLVLIGAGWRLFIGAWQSGEYFDGVLYLPMWIGYLMFVVALVAFGIRLLVNLISYFRR